MDDDFGFKLDYEPDSMFPCMANVLEFGRNSKGDVVMKAKEDIAVGKTVVVDKAYTTYLYSRFVEQCHICLKNDANLIPCKKCTVAMFFRMDKARNIFRAINLFTNAAEMMEFVEEAIQNDPNEMPKPLTDDKSEYRAFLKLPQSKGTQHPGVDKICRSLEYCLYRMLMDIPKIKAIFDTKKYQRFMHLTLHHAAVIGDNSAQMAFQLSNSPIGTRCCMIGAQLGILKPYFRHSCAQNVFCGNRGGNDVCITIRPIKKGEHLCT